QNRRSCSATRRRPVVSRTTGSGSSRRKGENSGAAVRISSSRARVRPTKKSRRSSSASAGRPGDSRGIAPAERPARNTAGNSKPLAPWSVIRRTAPEAQCLPDARRRSASWPRTRASQRLSKSSWNTAVFRRRSRAGEVPYCSSHCSTSFRGVSVWTRGSQTSVRSSQFSRMPWPRTASCRAAESSVPIFWQSVWAFWMRSAGQFHSSRRADSSAALSAGTTRERRKPSAPRTAGSSRKSSRPVTRQGISSWRRHFSTSSS
ncbi:Hydroxypyruvate isomerase, partial [Dysosmobacter welbionis]